MKRYLAIFVLFTAALPAQVYSPAIAREGAIDATSVQTLARTICRKANAQTQREKAEAIWRFFLTDGRFVPPGFWYHIAWWAYEEPVGEVLDTGKLLHSYGFGLCYQIAPLLEAVFESAGIPSRVWFLTGHTVTEVFYDGGWHYYDSDMLGYTPMSDKDFRNSPVAGVRDLEKDPGILLRKLASPTTTVPGSVPTPWYPADLNEKAIPGLAELFSTSNDNWLYPYTRYADFHSAAFVLRPGEKMVRYYQPEADGAYYLPFQTDLKDWKSRPKESRQYKIFTKDGPHAYNDARRWGTGRLEYHPALGDPSSFYPVFGQGFNQNLKAGRLEAADPSANASAVFEVTSPYVLSGAEFHFQAAVSGAEDAVRVETSVDNGHSWTEAGVVQGPHQGPATVSAAVLERAGAGVRTAVSGRYQYLVRFTLIGKSRQTPPSVSGLELRTNFQFNPRTLPELAAGVNELTFSTDPREARRETEVDVRQFDVFALRSRNVRFLAEHGQGFLIPASGEPAEVVFDVAVPDGAPLTGVHAGGRFLDLRGGIAPDKYTAETRQTSYAPEGPRAATLAWATSPEGPWQNLWSYDEKIDWRDGEKIDRLLRWPEVDRVLRTLPAGTKHVYLRYQVRNMALDSVRFAALTAPKHPQNKLVVRHEWKENGQLKQQAETLSASGQRYKIKAGTGTIENVSLTLEVPQE